MPHQGVAPQQLPLAQDIRHGVPHSEPELVPVALRVAPLLPIGGRDGAEFVGVAGDGQVPLVAQRGIVHGGAEVLQARGLGVLIQLGGRGGRGAEGGGVSTVSASWTDRPVRRGLAGAMATVTQVREGNKRYGRRDNTLHMLRGGHRVYFTSEKHPHVAVGEANIGSGKNCPFRNREPGHRRGRRILSRHRPIA